MKVLIDTNIIIDILEHREPFFSDSYRVIQLGLQGKLEGLLSTGSVADVYYVIRKSIRDAEKAKEKIIALTTLVSICDTTKSDISTALTLNIDDFEDAVIMAIARREKADFIITRNEADFDNSHIPVINPTRFVQQFFKSD